MGKLGAVGKKLISHTRNTARRGCKSGQTEFRPITLRQLNASKRLILTRVPAILILKEEPNESHESNQKHSRDSMPAIRRIRAHREREGRSPLH